MNQCKEYGNFVARAFCEGGPAMWVIGIVGLFTVVLVVTRFAKLKSMVIDKDSLYENLFNILLRGDVKQGIAYCDSKPAPLTNTLKSGLVSVLNKRPDEEVQVAMEASILRETPKLEGWVQLLAVFGNISVLIGLLGTISGMIKSFGGVAEADAATKAAELSRGISEALNCTAFGLLVAILAITSFGFFQIKIGKEITYLQEGSMNLLNLVAANRDKMKS